MHEKGNYYVKHGSIFTRSNPNIFFDEDTSILIDKELGFLIDVGRKDFIEREFRNMSDAYMQNGYTDYTDRLLVITFNICYPELGFKPDGYNFDIDEVCTIINWLSNSIGAEKVKWFLSLPVDEAREHIKMLQSYGC